MIGLYVRRGVTEGSFIPLVPSQSKYTLGRGDECSIRLPDLDVSRVHAEISYRKGRWWLRDLDSRNGTYLNAIPVKEHVLTTRDSVFLGHAELLVVERDDTAAASGGEPDGSGTRPSAFAPGQAIRGTSAAIREMIATLLRIAPTTSTVLVRGETGSGKELVARAIHASSRRRDGPFIALNCGSIPSALVESELFGHEAGAFTGATARRTGRFEAASGGTLFLDEIGDLPLADQTALLRVLEERTLRRVGGNEELRVDVRLIAATHRDLEAAVLAQTFREDLYHRVRVVEVRVPALRERLEDVEILANAFLTEVSQELGIARPRLTRDALTLLRSYRWPGNVRELKNLMERIALVVGSGEIGSDHLQGLGLVPASTASRSGPIDRGGEEGLEKYLERVETEKILAALESEGWNQSAAARRLKVAESTLRRRMQALRISRAEPE